MRKNRLDLTKLVCSGFDSVTLGKLNFDFTAIVTRQDALTNFG
jgi:hypothetical protein